MRIQTQLFLGTATLVLALVGVQGWLQARQLKAIETELNTVAANVGQAIFYKEASFQRSPAPPPALHVPLPHDRPMIAEFPAGAVPGEKIEFPTETKPSEKFNVPAEPSPEKAGERKPSRETKVVVRTTQTDRDPTVIQQKVYVFDNPKEKVRSRIEEGDSGANRFLVISGLPVGERRIPLPASHSSEIIQSTLQQGLAAGALLLTVGFLGAALFANRVTKPLRRLAEGAEALARGEFGTKVEGSGKGEIGELLATFNRMSAQLAQYEREKAVWEAREHLAELGDIARGLAHTLRNPLNTLGLAVEELAGDPNGSRQELVATSRAQIRRIDHWLRSFLAVGAGGAAEPEVADLREIVTAGVFEAVQVGAKIEIIGDESRMLPVKLVVPAFRSALMNLITNAVEASPEQTPVEISVHRKEDEGVVQIIDRGPGLPAEVKDKLFTPHITTKTGGSGMGVFLAKQLIEGGHGGTLEFADNPEGGTIAVVRVPLLQ